MNYEEISTKNKNINSDNYLINCYIHLTRSKTIHFIGILIEILLIIFQELEAIINGFIPEKEKKNLHILCYITNQFDRLSLAIKIVVLLFILFFDLFYFFLCKKYFKKKYISIYILSNILELFYFRAILLIFLNIFYTLPNIYYLVGLFFLIIHLCLILNNFMYNHLYFYVPKFINYPFDEFSSLFDVILLFLKIVVSIGGNSKNLNFSKFCFLIIVFIQVFFSFFFIYKLFNHSYLFMKNTFLNKTRLGFFLINTSILILAILVGSDEIISVLFLMLSLGIFFIIMIYMYLIYNPYHYIKININSPTENILFYLYVLADNNDLEFIIENKISEHFENCGLCPLCKKYDKYLEINQKFNFEDEKRMILIKNLSNTDVGKKDKLIDLFHVLYNGNNKYFELIRNITINYKNKGKDSFNNNNSYYYINLSFLIYSDYLNSNKTLFLNEKIILENFNKQNKLLDNHEAQIKEILFCNTFINLGNKILLQLKDIIKCDQNKNKVKKLLELSVSLKEMRKPKYKKYLISHKQENSSNSRNLITVCSIVYEEIFNTVINNSQIPLRYNLQPLEDIFHNNSNKLDRIISLLFDLTNNTCKIVRAGRDLYYNKNNNLFDLFPLVFKEYQINLFLSNLLENYDVNLKKKKEVRAENISNKSTKKFSYDSKKIMKFMKTISNANNKSKKNVQYIETKVVISDVISSKIYYKLLSLKLIPLFNSDVNNYSILFDGIFSLNNSTIITIKDFQNNNDSNEYIFSVSDPELEKPGIYTMTFQKYARFQNNNGFNLKQITKFNLSTKFYSIYTIEPKNQAILKRKTRKINMSVLRTKIGDDFEDEYNKNLFIKNSNLEKIYDDITSVNSQQANTVFSNELAGLGIKNKKRNSMYEYNNLKNLRKTIFYSMPILLIYLICEFICIRKFEKDLKNKLNTYMKFREIYSLYFQLFTSILSISCIKTDINSCTSLISIYAKLYDYSQIDGNFDFMSYVRGQSIVLAEKMTNKRNDLINIHQEIGEKKYKEIFGQNIEYFKISQNFIEEKIEFNLSILNIEFSESILMILNSYQTIINNTCNDPILFLDKIEEPFTLLNSDINHNSELTDYQKNIYEMILNYKIYAPQLNNINEKLYKILLLSKRKVFQILIYLILILNTLLIFIVTYVLYFYFLFFENIIMKIFNYINMIINIKNDQFNFYSIFSQKIENLETILSIYKEDPVKCIKQLTKIYMNYQQYLISKNKKNINEKKKNDKKDENNNEMDNIPKNQILVTKKDIRNFHIIFNYLIYIIYIIFSFLTSSGGLAFLWYIHFYRQTNFYILLDKDFKLEYSIYNAINIYNLIIFHNYTNDELSNTIFKYNLIKIKKINDVKENTLYTAQNITNELLNHFYKDMQLIYNNINEKEKLNRIYSEINYNNINFTCEFLYDTVNDTIDKVEKYFNVVGLINSKEKLKKICKKSRIDESNDILSLFEYHFQNIKNAILSISDFTYQGLINHINSGMIGKISVFFNCMIIYLLEFTNNNPHKKAINFLNYLLNRNIIITEIIFIIPEFFVVNIIFVIFILNIKNYCNQILLLKYVFKINEVQEQ